VSVIPNLIDLLENTFGKNTFVLVVKMKTGNTTPSERSKFNKTIIDRGKADTPSIQIFLLVFFNSQL
jgi:hypothetical protein